MRPIILIPARYAATRLPGKPLLDIGGKPMIVCVWERAAASGVGEVVVATDDARILRAIEDAGGRAVMTREDHPSGSDRIFEALQQCDAAAQHDVVINLQGDMPTLDPKVIGEVLALLENPLVDIGTLAALIRDPAEREDPAVVKPIIAFDSPGRRGQALDFTRETPESGINAYHHIGIYAYRREALERFVNLRPSAREQERKLEQLRALDAGMRIDVSVVDTVPLGVDTPETLEKARKIYAPL